MAGSLLPELTFRRLSVILVVLQLSHVAEARLMHSRAWAFYFFFKVSAYALTAASVVFSSPFTVVVLHSAPIFISNISARKFASILFLRSVLAIVSNAVITIATSPPLEEDL